MATPGESLLQTHFGPVFRNLPSLVNENIEKILSPEEKINLAKTNKKASIYFKDYLKDMKKLYIYLEKNVIQRQVHKILYEILLIGSETWMNMHRLLRSRTKEEKSRDLNRIVRWEREDRMHEEEQQRRNSSYYEQLIKYMQEFKSWLFGTEDVEAPESQPFLNLDALEDNLNDYWEDGRQAMSGEYFLNILSWMGIPVPEISSLGIDDIKFVISKLPKRAYTHKTEKYLILCIILSKHLKTYEDLASVIPNFPL